MRTWPIYLALAGLPLLAVAGLVSGCTPLTMYNSLTPADSGGVIAASGLPYGRDPRQRLDVYIPTTRPTSAPVVVFFYGGSWNSGRRQDYAFVGKAFAARGFVVVVSDYRLVPDVRFPAFLEDSARVAVWAHANARQFGGDPSRVFLLGHSAGAYNAAMIALDPRYLEAAGAPASILRGVAALAGPYDFLPLDVGSTIAAFGQANDLRQTQPINFVSGPAPAMFLATGEADTTVKPRNTRRLAEALRMAGGKVTVRTYPDAGHVGILLALSVAFRGKAPVLDDVIAFFESTQ